VRRGDSPFQRTQTPSSPSSQPSSPAGSALPIVNIQQQSLRQTAHSSANVASAPSPGRQQQQQQPAPPSVIHQYRIPYTSGAASASSSVVSTSNIRREDYTSAATSATYTSNIRREEYTSASTTATYTSNMQNNHHHLPNNNNNTINRAAGLFSAPAAAAENPERGVDDQHGGDNNNTIMTTSCGWSEVVDPSAAASPSARSLHSAALLNGVMYVFGGYDGSQRVNSFHAYSFADKRWSPVSRKYDLFSENNYFWEKL
jgi:hypothetical protein